MKFRKKPVIIDAVQWTGANIEEIKKFMEADKIDNSSNFIYIHTLEGIMQVSINDFIIKGVQGEFYPCKPDIFESTYEAVL